MLSMTRSSSSAWSAIANRWNSRISRGDRYWPMNDSSLKLRIAKSSVVSLTLLVQPVQDRVVPERRPPLVHHLRLRLRMKVLRELADDPHELALPRLELGRELLDEVQDVFLRFGRKDAAAGLARVDNL